MENRMSVKVEEDSIGSLIFNLKKYYYSFLFTCVDNNRGKPLEFDIFPDVWPSGCVAVAPLPTKIMTKYWPFINLINSAEYAHTPNLNPPIDKISRFLGDWNCAHQPVRPHRPSFLYYRVGNTITFFPEHILNVIAWASLPSMRLRHALIHGPPAFLPAN